MVGRRAVETVEHQRVGATNGLTDLVVRNVSEPTPRRDTCRPQRFRLPHVSDAADESLVEERVAELAPLVGRAQAAQHLVVIGRLGEDVRPDPAGASPLDLEDGATEQRACVLPAAQEQPRRSDDSRVALEDAPAALHPQVASNGDAALEMKQEVLADCLDAVESTPVQDSVQVLHRGARMRGLDLERVADQHLEATRGAVECITFGHAGNGRSMRPVAAGAVAALTWAAVDPISRRVFKCEYSDPKLVGLPLHVANGAVFGLVYSRVKMNAVTLALIEHVTLWPFLALLDADAVRSPRAFAKSGAEHALFGLVLEQLA